MPRLPADVAQTAESPAAAKAVLDPAVRGEPGEGAAGAAGPDQRGGAGRGRADEHARTAVVGGDGAGGGARAVEPLVRVDRQAVPVSIEEHGGRGPAHLDGRRDGVGDERPASVGADDEAGPLRPDGAAGSRAVTPTTRPRRRAADRSPRCRSAAPAPASTRGVGEDRVDQCPARRVERVDTGGGTDRHRSRRRRRSGRPCGVRAGCRPRRSRRAGPTGAVGGCPPASTRASTGCRCRGGSVPGTAPATRPAPAGMPSRRRRRARRPRRRPTGRSRRGPSARPRAVPRSRSRSCTRPATVAASCRTPSRTTSRAATATACRPRTGPGAGVAPSTCRTSPARSRTGRCSHGYARRYPVAQITLPIPRMLSRSPRRRCARAVPAAAGTPPPAGGGRRTRRSGPTRRAGGCPPRRWCARGRSANRDPPAVDPVQPAGQPHAAVLQRAQVHVPTVAVSR